MQRRRRVGIENKLSVAHTHTHTQTDDLGIYVAIALLNLFFINIV